VPAGGFPAGFGPAGLDPLPSSVPPRTITPPAALWFDGASQDYLYDPATGLYLELNPIDQQVALALCLNLGSIASASGAGAGFRSIQRITRSTKTEVERDANDALLSLVQRRVIQIDSIAVDLYVLGGFAVAVTYENLTTKKKPTFTAPQGSFTGL
jgi:hypothetical protein